MRTTAVSQLKVSLSACLRQVQAGEELIITKGGRPIARLLPLSRSAPLPEHLRVLGKKGLSQRGEKPLPFDFWVLATSRRPPAAVRSTVLREREEGW